MFRTTKVSDFNCDSGIGGYCPVAAISSLRVSYLTLSCPHRTASCFIIAVTPTGLDEPTRKPRVSLVIMQLISALKKRSPGQSPHTHTSMKIARNAPHSMFFPTDFHFPPRLPSGPGFPWFSLGFHWVFHGALGLLLWQGLPEEGHRSPSSGRRLWQATGTWRGPNFRGGWGICWCNKIVCRHLYYINSVHINISDILI